MLYKTLLQPSLKIFFCVIILSSYYYLRIVWYSFLFISVSGVCIINFSAISSFICRSRQNLQKRRKKKLQQNTLKSIQIILTQAYNRKQSAKIKRTNTKNCNTRKEEKNKHLIIWFICTHQFLKHTIQTPSCECISV